MKSRAIVFSYSCILGLALLGVHLASNAAFRIGGQTQEIPATQFRAQHDPKPVQILFEFRRNGVQDAGITGFLWNAAVVQVEKSGLFSEVFNRPVAGGAFITIVLDSRLYDGEKVGSSNSSVAPPDIDAIGGDALRGDVFCIAKFYPATGLPAIEKQSRQQFYFDWFGSPPPPGTIRIGNRREAQEVTYRTLLRQVISIVLNDLSHDPSFPLGEGK